MTGAPIVVGVDDSPASRGALRWAAREAARSGADLDVIFVFTTVTPMGFLPGEPQALAIDRGQIRRDASALVRRLATDAGLEEGPKVRLAVIDDPSPAHALADAAADASMLVVGAHRRHGLGVLLGSTSGSCIRHALCPVVVVPEGTCLPAQRQESPVQLGERTPA